MTNLSKKFDIGNILSKVKSHLLKQKGVDLMANFESSKDVPNESEQAEQLQKLVISKQLGKHHFALTFEKIQLWDIKQGEIFIRSAENSTLLELKYKWRNDAFVSAWGKKEPENPCSMPCSQSVYRLINREKIQSPVKSSKADSLRQLTIELTAANTIHNQRITKIQERS